MNLFKKIIFALLIVANCYVLYASIGFYVMGSSAPKLIGNTKAMFMGNYVLSIVFGVGFIILSVIITLLGINIFKTKKSR